MEFVYLGMDRTSAIYRRFVFEFVKLFGVLWFIDQVPGIRIKEPFNKMYQRSKKIHSHAKN